MSSLHKSAAEASIYVVLALVAVSPGLSDASQVIGDGVDMYGTFWFYWWAGHSLASGVDPGFTELMFHPYGKDIFAHTGGNFIDALASLPFQWVWGVPNYQPWFIAAVMLGNAWAFRRLLVGLHVVGLPCVVATCLWMLNPYVLFELLTGRITQAFLIFLPLAIHHFLRIPQGSPRDAVLAGVYTALQAWTYWFMGGFMALGFVVLATGQIVGKESSVKDGIKGWFVAASSCLALVAPALWLMVQRTGQGDVPGLGQANGWTGFWRGLDGVDLPRLHGWLLNEQSGVLFFGHPFWFGLACLVVFSPQISRRWGLYVLAALAFAVGPSLTVVGQEPIPMPHYLWAYHFVPFFERLWFPYRWIGMAFFGVCLGMGLILHSRKEALGKLLPFVSVALIGLGIMSQVRAGAFPLKTRTWEVPESLREVGRRGGGIIEIPMMVPRASLMYQSVHQQPLFGGMGENAPIFWPRGFKHQMGNHFIRALRQAVRTHSGPHSYIQADVAALQQTGMRWVILDRDAQMNVVQKASWWALKPELRRATSTRTVAVLTDMMGPPVAVDEHLVVWDLEKGQPFSGALAPTEERIKSEAWLGEFWSSYESNLGEP